jgi:hypothetical protein
VPRTATATKAPVGTHTAGAAGTTATTKTTAATAPVAGGH